MGEQSSRSLGGFSSEGRLSDPFHKPQTASFISPPQRLSILSGESGKVSCSATGNKGHACHASYRDSRPARTGILQQTVLSPKTRREMAPGVRCVTAEQIHLQDQVLHGDSPDSTGCNSQRGLDDIYGHEGCIFPHPDSSSVQEISEVCFQQKDLSVQSNVFWSEHSPSSVYESIGPTEQNSPSCGLQNYPVPGRLANSSQFQRRGVESQGVHSKISRPIRYFNKQRKVSFGPVTVYQLPGDGDKFHDFLGFPDPETDRQSFKNFQRILTLKSNVCKILAADVGSYVIPGEICTWCETSHETLPVLPQKGLEKRLTAQGYFDSSPIKPKRKSCMVASRGQARKRSVTRAEGPGSHPVHGCLQKELGGYVKSEVCFGDMVTQGEKGTYQQVGIEGNLLCLTESRGNSSREDSSSIFRQHDSSLLHKETGRNKVLGIIQIGGRIAPVDGEIVYHSYSQIYRGEKQQCGRHSEQEGASSSYRVDPEQSSMSDSMEEVGSSTGGCLCHLFDKEDRHILCSSFRSQCSRCRCPLAGMGQPRSLCVSPIRSSEESNKQVQKIPELSNDVSSTLVATEGVVPRPSKPTSGRSKVSSSEDGSSVTANVKIPTPRIVRSSSDRLETVIRLGREKGLSESVTKRIFSARSASTNALYQLRWKQYVRWCRDNKYSAIRPSTNSLCKFFIYLWEVKKLAVGTIKGFRSVLQSVLRHNELDISHNLDISDVIRSFIIERPVVKKNTISWNVDIVLNFLCSTKFEPLGYSSLRDITRKTLFLLALALAKRVSELQALSSNEGFTKQGAVVSLILNFRAKNDNKMKGLPRNFVVKGLQDLVGPEEERKLCPVRALRAYLQRTKEFRDGQSTNLFLAPSNPRRIATKNALAYLLKSTIIEAHKDVSTETGTVCKVKPHEMRAVATSLSFEHNLSIDSVLEAAQWRSNSVFASHYLKEISIQYENCRALGPVVSAGTVIA